MSAGRALRTVSVMMVRRCVGRPCAEGMLALLVASWMPVVKRKKGCTTTCDMRSLMGVWMSKASRSSVHAQESKWQAVGAALYL